MPDHRPGILLADDNPDMRMLLEIAFAESRFEIVGIAESGDEALTLWARERDRIDAAALDLRMPGPDGLDVARALLADRPGLPIVLFSAELNRELTAQAAALGVGIQQKDEILQLPRHPSFS